MSVGVLSHKLSKNLEKLLLRTTNLTLILQKTESGTEYESMDAQDDDSDETDDEDVNEDDCDESSEVMTIIGVHELHGRMHPN